MSEIRSALSLTLVTLVLAAALPASADTVVLSASRDNTLFEDVDGELSNGVGEHLYAGRTLGSVLRRAVIAFDVAAALPADATVTSVELTLDVSLVRDDSSFTFELHRLLADWGEGTSNSIVNGGGMGTASTTGDATWVHTFFDTGFWSTPGGDADPTVSGAKTVGDFGTYTWSSTPQMVADVQGWLDDPSSNFGWLLTGDEVSNGSAKRFDSRERSDPMARPRLTVSFDVLIFADGFETGDFSAWN